VYGTINTTLPGTAYSVPDGPSKHIQYSPRTGMPAAEVAFNRSGPINPPESDGRSGCKRYAGFARYIALHNGASETYNERNMLTAVGTPIPAIENEVAVSASA
jgi:hypothetical protein